MPEHLGGTLWQIDKNEYLEVEPNIAIVGPTLVRINEFGFDAEANGFLFSLQLGAPYQIRGETPNFSDLVKQGPLPPDCQKLDLSTS